MFFCDAQSSALPGPETQYRDFDYFFYHDEVVANFEAEKKIKEKYIIIESVDSYFTNILQLLDDRPQLRSSIETLQGP